jgi:hypothetical protein
MYIQFVEIRVIRGYKRPMKSALRVSGKGAIFAPNLFETCPLCETALKKYTTIRKAIPM